jgi:hypothetical protein
MPDEPEQLPEHWPEGVFPLYIEEFQKLGRDKKNALFWDGKPLVTKNQYVFTSYQIFFVDPRDYRVDRDDFHRHEQSLRFSLRPWRRCTRLSRRRAKSINQNHC